MTKQLVQMQRTAAANDKTVGYCTLFLSFSFYYAVAIGFGLFVLLLTQSSHTKNSFNLSINICLNSFLVALVHFR